MRTAARFAIVLLALAGCETPLVAPAAAETSCLFAFRDYDRAVLLFGDGGRERNFRLPPAVSRTGQRLRDRGCLTTSDNLAGMEVLGDELRGTLRAESGAPIPPISLHAGIVQGITTEVQVRIFFDRLGFRVRSIGAPGLGRRIFLGPFTTEGGLAEATDVAQRAGFVAPYPRRF